MQRTAGSELEATNMKVMSARNTVVVPIMRSASCTSIMKIEMHMYISSTTPAAQSTGK